MPTTYNADQIIGKQLFAKKTIKLVGANNVYEISPSQEIGIIKKGNIVGRVYSYLRGRNGINGAYNGKIYWVLEEKVNNKYVNVLHETGAFDLDSLKEQGIKTEAEKEEEKKEEDKPFVEKIAETIGSGLKKIIIIGGIAFLVYKIGTFAISQKLKTKN